MASPILHVRDCCDLDPFRSDWQRFTSGSNLDLPPDVVRGLLRLSATVPAGTALLPRTVHPEGPWVGCSHTLQSPSAADAGCRGCLDGSTYAQRISQGVLQFVSFLAL